MRRPYRPAWNPASPGPVPSPCNSICRMDAGSGLCEGCLRSIDEIAQWARLDDDAKRAVWQQLHGRAATRDPA